MRLINSILVPVDLSSASEAALRYAIRFADSVRAKVQVLHCLNLINDVPEIPAYDPKALEGIMESSRVRLEAFSDRIKKEEEPHCNEPPIVNTQVEVGPVRFVVQDVAREQGFDLIILGTKGAKNLLDDWVGSISTAIIQRAPCPVLIVPEEATFKPIKQFCFATDLQFFDLERMLKTVQILHPLSPMVRCTYIKTTTSEPKDQAIIQLQNQYRQEGYPFEATFHEVFADSVWDGLTQFAEAYPIDWLVMYRPRRNWLDQLFHRSLTRQGALHTTLPLLVLDDGLHESEMPYADTRDGITRER